MHAGPMLKPSLSLTAVFQVWRYFKTRIAYEEVHLRRIFPDEYDAYRRRTPTWFPLIP